MTWNTIPRILNSDLKWTNSFKLDIIDHSWPPLPKTGHTGPVYATGWRHMSYVAFSGALVENWSELAIPSNVATVGHSSLWPDILYGYGPFLATFALTRHNDFNIIKSDRKCQNCSKKVIQGQIWTLSIISRYYNKYWTIITHIRSNSDTLVSEGLTFHNLIY